jgi:hypothetical protein
VNYTRALYGPVYKLLGVPAELVAGLVTFSFTVLDVTAGIQQGGAVDVASELPKAKARAMELLDLGIVPDTDLDGSQITFNNQTWRIASHKPLPSPNGDEDGEIELTLEGLT